MIEVQFLGTSSMFPTKERAQSCIFLKCGPNNFLFDCGENAQRQMRLAGLSPMSIDRIFVSHWHGDHTLGLSGLIQSMAANKRERKLEIYGPAGTSERMYHLLRSFLFDMSFKVETMDIAIKNDKTVTILDSNDFEVQAFPLKHIVPCIGFSFIKKGIRKINLDYTKKFGLIQHPLLGKLQKGQTIEYKGKKITPEKGTYTTPSIKVSYIADTSYFKELIDFAKDANLLISESTYGEDIKDKALRYTHLTAKQAAQIAKKAKAKQLALTHFSQRYTNVAPLEKDAKKVFKNTVMAKDFLRLKVL